MIDRISTSLSQQLGINAITLQQARLNEIQQQISLGKKILKPSDDPAGAVQVLDLNQSLSRLDQFQKNLDYAENRLALSEGTLQSVTNSIQRVRELAVQGFNATNTASDRASIAQEMFQRLDEVIALANTKDANGDYLYAGFKGQTQPFTGNADSGNFSYQGDQGQRLLQIGEGRTVSDGNSGAEIFYDIKDKDGNQEDIFTTLYSLATDLSINRPAQEEAIITTAVQPADGETVTINGITYEFESAGGVAVGNTAVPIGGTTDITTANLGNAINIEQGLGNTDVTATVVGSNMTLLADSNGLGTLNFIDGTAGDLSITSGPSVPLYDHLDQIDTALGQILDVRSQIGARLNVVDSQDEINQDFTLAIQETKSQVEDLDLAAAISEFNLQIAALQAAQQAFIRVQGLSLFNEL
jgi:flagellar hook-associated protein 3 FlgL